MTATQFTPLASTIGGVLIGIAAVMLMLFNGRIAGVSGILGRLLPPSRNNDVIGAAAFILGTSYGGGCTSGHGVCGLSRLSLRSVAATAHFMATAFETVFVARHMLGG